MGGWSCGSGCDEPLWISSHPGGKPGPAGGLLDVAAAALHASRSADASASMAMMSGNPRASCCWHFSRSCCVSLCTWALIAAGQMYGSYGALSVLGAGVGVSFWLWSCGLLGDLASVAYVGGNPMSGRGAASIPTVG